MLMIALQTCALVLMAAALGLLAWIAFRKAPAGGVESALAQAEARLREDLAAGRRDAKADLEAARAEMGAALAAHRQEGAASAAGLRKEVSESFLSLSQAHSGRFEALSARQQERLEAVEKTLADLAHRTERRLESLQKTLEENLQKLRESNEGKLEQMRATVDEKLQDTLEKRLGQSFALVSERLEQVHKGIGEMQSLASGVGDLKRVLTNVRARGSWGEVHLSMLLNDLLTVEQFATNVRIRPDSAEAVEFAIKLPGREDGAPVYLPIDAKFPQADYERLLRAQETGATDEADQAAEALAKAVALQAKAISEKYIHPPHSTDFAVLYLPTEGLFAEIVRRPGLVVELQSKYRIVVTGPTTLAALLNSLQMGFRTLAIEKRSSEVWQVLAAAKAEFGKYAAVWDKLGKQLDTARRTVDEAGQRTRAVRRRLANVETMAPAEAERLLRLPPAADSDDEEGAEAA